MKHSGVLICGYYGHYNLGDEAMLAGMLIQLRQWQPKLKTTVFSNNPTDTQRRHNVETLSQQKPRRRLQKWQQQYALYQALWRHRYFVLGGGDLLRDSISEPVAQIWLKPAQQAIRLGRKTCLWGISVGDIWRPETKSLIPQVLNKIDLIAVRDQASQICLQHLGVTHPIFVIPDLALTGLSTACLKPKPSGPWKIGISFRDISNRAVADPLQVQAFRKTVAKTIDLISETYNTQIHLIPMQSFPETSPQTQPNRVDDYSQTLAMLQECQQTTKVKIHSHISTVDEVNCLLNQMHVVIGTRLHAIILASGQGTPVIALEYDPKVKNFMADSGQSRYSVNLTKFTPTHITTKLGEILQDWPQAQSQVKHNIEKYRQLAPDINNALTEFWQPTH